MAYRPELISGSLSTLYLVYLSTIKVGKGWERTANKKLGVGTSRPFFTAERALKRASHAVRFTKSSVLIPAGRRETISYSVSAMQCRAMARLSLK